MMEFVLSLNEKEHNIDVPTFKLPACSNIFYDWPTPHTQWPLLTISVYDNLVIGSSSGPSFIVKDLPSVLILVLTEQMLNDSLCYSNKYN